MVQELLYGRLQAGVPRVVVVLLVVLPYRVQVVAEGLRAVAGREYSPQPVLNCLLGGEACQFLVPAIFIHPLVEFHGILEGVLQPLLGGLPVLRVPVVALRPAVQTLAADDYSVVHRLACHVLLGPMCPGELLPAEPYHLHLQFRGILSRVMSGDPFRFPWRAVVSDQ